MSEPIQSAEIGDLVAAIAAVMAGFRGVEKSGENKFHKYNYASDADILWTVKPLLADNGLSFTLVRFDQLAVSEVKTSKGGSERLIDLSVTYRIAHKSGQWMLITAPGSGQDPGDKAHYKAMTGALKYAMRQTFAIPTGDDPEADDRDNRRDDRRREPDPRRDDRREDPPRQDGREEQADDPPVNIARFLEAMAAVDAGWTRQAIQVVAGCTLENLRRSGGTKMLADAKAEKIRPPKPNNQPAGGGEDEIP